jgi:HSP20 family protein
MVDLKSLVPWRNHRGLAGRDELFPFQSLRREFDRMFEDVVGRGWLLEGLSPAVDVHQDDKEVVVTAELPGMSEKDIEVSLAGELLTIKGEKKSEHEEKEGGAHRTERRYGAFERTIRLPFAVKDDPIDATFANGVLTVRLRVPEELKKPVRKIEIKGESGPSSGTSS